MLSFDLRMLANRAIVVDDELAPDDAIWQAEDPRPVGPIRVTGRLSVAGPGQYYLHGRLAGLAAGECRRCLGPVHEPIADDLQLIFADHDAEGADDPDVYTLDPTDMEIDLRPAVREHWLLDAPRFSLCDENCKGLCPVCGADLNVGSCGCTPGTTDTRWEALRQVRSKPK
ncbi:MAG: hypothetical protein NVS4B3_19380 [Gemmatimonadaceae bacterium]